MSDRELLKSAIHGIVYKITNKVNNKKYIGITTRSIEERFEEHCKAKSGIGYAIRKHGRSNFKITELEYAEDQEELIELEMENIKKYKTFKTGYNQTIGGEGVNLLEDLDLKLSDRQIDFIKKVRGQNEKEIDVTDNAEMIKSILRNVIEMYLTANRPMDKIRVSRTILRFKPNLLELILGTGLINLEEVRHYSLQNYTTFEPFEECKEMQRKAGCRDAK